MSDFYGHDRRSSIDRRHLDVSVNRDRRTGQDRREYLRHQQVLLSRLKKSSLFVSFTDSLFELITIIGSKIELEKNAVLISEGVISEDIFVLLEGILQMSRAGREINLLSSIELAVEPGTFTGLPNFTTVTARKNVTLMRLSKIELTRAYEINYDLYVALLEGILRDQARKNMTLAEIVDKLKSSRL